MKSKPLRWVLGLTYIFAVAAIWIAASFVVQSVVDGGVSPFLVTYICNSLFVIYIPLVEIGRYLEDTYGGLLFWRYEKSGANKDLGESEHVVLLNDNDVSGKKDVAVACVNVEGVNSQPGSVKYDIVGTVVDRVKDGEGSDSQLDAKGRWTRTRVAKVSLLICPFWFLAQFTFNLSLKYTTVTSNTIMSSSSSLFTFLVSLVFLGEKFTWVKLISVLICMGGTIAVSMGDSESAKSAIATDPLLGDILSLLSAGFYAVYVTLIRKKMPDDDDEKSGQASMAQLLGYLGLFNIFLFLPVALIVNFTNLEPFNTLTWKQFGLISGKGLLDNVLSDYLWAKAVLLTTTTVATAGLTIQVPLAAIVDSVTGNAPHLMDYLGAVAVIIGFAGLNMPSDPFGRSEQPSLEMENENISSANRDHSTASQNETLDSI